MAIFKDKYTNTWAVKFRYKDWTGKVQQHKKTGFKTQKEAKAYESEYSQRLEGSSDITFKRLYEYYIKDCEVRLKPTTVSMKRWMFESHINPYFDNIKVKDITTEKIRSWQTELLKQQYGCTERKKYTLTYLKTLNCQLSSSLNFAVRVFGLRQNPCSIVGSMGKGKAEKMKFWTFEEFSSFIKTFDDKPLYKTLFTLMFFSGIRFGEAMALTMDDFDVFNKTVKISKSLSVARGKVYLLTPKTELSARTIPLPECVISMIVALFNQTYEKDSSAPLFPIARTTVRTRFDNGIKESGVKKIRIHDLRHSHASMLMNMGTPIKQISERLGHKDIKITLEIYSHLYKEKETELVDKLNQISLKMAQ